MHQHGDVLELALDRQLHFMAAMREKHFAVAVAQAQDSVGQPARSQPKRIGDRPARISDQRMHRIARRIQKWHQQYQQDQQRR